MAATVIEQYCALHHIAPDQFTEHLLRQTLHAPARLLRPVLRALWPELFTTDLTYLSCIGRTRSLDQVQEESRDFRRDRANRRFPRRVLHLRVSVRRVHAAITPLLD